MKVNSQKMKIWLSCLSFLGSASQLQLSLTSDSEKFQSEKTDAKNRNFIYFTKIGALNIPPVQRAGVLGGSTKARRSAAEQWRIARHQSEAACRSGLASMPPLQRGRLLCGSNTVRRSAAEQSRRARQQSEADCGSTVARGPPLQRGGSRQYSGPLALGPLTSSGRRRQPLLRKRRFAAVQRPTAPVESGGFRQQRAREGASRAWRAAAECGGLRQYSASPKHVKVARFQS